MVAPGSFEFRLKRTDEEQIHIHKYEVRLKRDTQKKAFGENTHFDIRLKRTVE